MAVPELTLSDLRSRLRKQVLDENSVRWTNTELDAQLNASAKHVARQLPARESPHYARGTYTITATTGVKDYDLTSIDDFYMFRTMLSDDDSDNPTLIEEAQRDHYLAMYPDGLSPQGSRFFFMRRDPADLTTPYSVHFLVAPDNGAEFLVVYDRMADTISGDSAVFELFPVWSQDLLIAHAAFVLLSNDGSVLAEKQAALFQLYAGSGTT